MPAPANMVTVEVIGGPSQDVAWTSGMSAQDALELAWNTINSTAKFTFGLQYYGTSLGYMGFMINETYDSFISSEEPYFYWEFLVNNTAQAKGIDGASAYSVMGRLEDIPLNVTQVMPEHPMDPSLNKLQSLGPGSGAVGSYFGDPGEHGGLAKPITAAERAQWAKEGVAMIEATLKAADMKGIVQAMRDHDKFTQNVILPKYGTILPK
jgi:hypothetical protein